MPPILGSTMTLITVVDNLRDGYAQLEPGSMLHAKELLEEQLRDPSLQRQSHYLADGPIYANEEGTQILGMTRLPDNLVLRHLFDKKNSSYNQLCNTGNFRSNPEEARAALQAEGTLRTNLRKLRLQGDNQEYGSLVIRTADGFINTGRRYEEPNEDEQPLIERFGYTLHNLPALLKSDYKIRETRLHVLKPDYVQHVAVNGPIGRAAWRSYLNYDANSYADDKDVFSHRGLRGVRRVVVPESSL